MVNPERLKDAVVIDGAQYPLARDVAQNWPGIAWRVEESVPEQEGRGEMVSATWPIGWPDGMGETTRVGPNSRGYAFGEGMLCADTLFARLSPRVIESATLTNALTDQPTYFFDAKSAAASTIGMQVLTSGSDETNATSYNTASISPAANNLIIAAVSSRRGTDFPTTPTLSGASLTWVELGTITQSTGFRLTVFTAIGASPTSGAVTIDFGTEPQLRCLWSITQFYNVDTDSPTGSSAGNSGSGTTPSATLSTFSNSANRPYMAAMGSGTPTFTPETNYSLIHQVDLDHTIAIEWHPDEADTTPSGTWSQTSSWGAIAVEIKAATGTVADYLYCVNGRFAYKLSISDTTITVEEEKDFGSGAVAGKPVKFEGKWYVPLGADVAFVELTTIATPPTADTWTSVSTPLYALATASIQDGATAKIARGYSSNLVDLAATTPTTSTNWTTNAWEVGDSSTAITNMLAARQGDWVAKQDNLYRIDTTGAAWSVFEIGPGAGDTNNGCGLINFGTSDIVFYNHERGLFCYAYGDTKEVGVDAILTNEYIPNVTLEPIGGRHYEGAVASPSWIYYDYRVTETATRTYIMAGNIQGGNPFDIQWHPMAYYDGVIRGCHVDIGLRLWGANVTANKLQFYQLGANGSPNAGRDAIGYGAASTTHRFYLPETDFGLPHVEKILHDVEAYFKDISTTAQLTFECQRDGGALEEVGVAVTDTEDPVARRYWEQPSEEELGRENTCVRLRPVLKVTTTSGYSSTSDSVDPRIYSLTVRAFTRPKRADEIRFIVDTTKLDASMDTGRDIRDRLRTLRDDKRAVDVIDPDGNEFHLLIKEVSDLTLREYQDGLHWQLDVRAREWTDA